ncbi:MAG: hypothetical protein AYK19_07805 [Theionarchaea archaeon DG-70-1]|nr:MAG: hypothetical protein AYK19_07805 [Theionarchaea archaeon DG-70-1]
MSRFSPEKKQSLFRGIYEADSENPRLRLYELAEYLGTVRNTAAEYRKMAYENQILFPPQLRLKMFSDVKEYACAFKADDAFRVFEQLKSDPRVCYQVLCKGRLDLLVITSFPFSVKEVAASELIFRGARSDYIVPYVSDIDGKTALNLMMEKVEESPSPSKWEVTYPRREIFWTNHEWDLFQLLRHNASRPYTELASRIPLHYDTFSSSLERIFANTILFVPYYPKGYESYMSWILIFKSNYEQLLIDMLSCQPCTTVLYKVADWFVADVKVETNLAGHYLRLLYGLEDTGIIDMFDVACAALYWQPDP